MFDDWLQQTSERFGHRYGSSILKKAGSLETLTWLASRPDVPSQVFEGPGQWLMEKLDHFPETISSWLSEHVQVA